MKTSTRIATIVLVAASLPAIAAAPANAGDDNEASAPVPARAAPTGRSRSSRTTAGSRSRPRSTATGSGQDWRWRLKRDGELVDRGTATTRRTERLLRGRAEGRQPRRGKDTFKFRAKNNGQRSGLRRPGHHLTPSVPCNAVLTRMYRLVCRTVGSTH